MYYYGVHSCDCLPKEDIGVKYWSTSKRDGFIKDQKENPQDYKYKVIKIFSTRVEAVEHEIFLHKKFDVKLHPKFYNDSNQKSTNFDTTGKGSYIDESGKTILIPREEALLRGLKGESAGRKKSPETIAKIVSANTGSKRTNETKAKMSAWQKGLSLEEIYGDKAEAKRKACGHQLGVPKEKINCELCGKNVTINTSSKRN